MRRIAVSVLAGTLWATAVLPVAQPSVAAAGTSFVPVADAYVVETATAWMQAKRNIASARETHRCAVEPLQKQRQGILRMSERINTGKPEITDKYTTMNIEDRLDAHCEIAAGALINDDCLCYRQRLS